MGEGKRKEKKEMKPRRKKPPSPPQTKTFHLIEIIIKMDGEAQWYLSDYGQQQVHKWINREVWLELLHFGFLDPDPEKESLLCLYLLKEQRHRDSQKYSPPSRATEILPLFGSPSVKAAWLQVQPARSLVSIYLLKSLYGKNQTQIHGSYGLDFGVFF